MINKFKYITAGIMAIAIASCSTDDKVTDTVQDDVERGAVLRTTQVFSNELPIGIDTAAFSVEIEEQDIEGGALLQSVDVFATFADNSEDDGDTSGANFNEFSLGTIDASEFSPGPFGLPRTTLNYPLDVLNSGANVTADQLFGGDTFTIRLSLNLTDGRVFSTNNAGGIITGGFFNSPFQYVATVTCPVEETFAIGTYALEIVEGVFPDFGATVDWVEGNYNVVMGEGSTARVVEDVPYLPEFGDFIGPLEFNLVCGSVNFPNQAIGGGVGCGGAIQGDSMGTTFGSYDAADDSVFTVSFIVTAGDSGSSCPSSDYTATLRFTKQ